MIGEVIIAVLSGGGRGWGWKKVRDRTGKRKREREERIEGRKNERASERVSEWLLEGRSGASRLMVGRAGNPRSY